MESRKLEKTTEPGIFKRGNRYVVMYRDGFGRQHKRAAGATMKEARDTKARLRADVSRGEDTEATRENFATYATRWIESYAGRNGSGIREETRRDYKRVLEQDAVPFLGHVRLSQIRQKHLDELVSNPLPTDDLQTPCLGLDRSVKPFRGLEPELPPEAHRTEHSQRIVVKSGHRIKRRPEQLRIQVLEPFPKRVKEIAAMQVAH